MFQTHESAKINFPSEAGLSLWSHVELPVNQTWFLATCLVTNEIGTVSSSYLLTKSNQIAQLKLQPDISIEAVYVIRPPISNIRNSWELDKLNSLRSGFFENDGTISKVEIYDLADGVTYFSNANLKSSEGIINITVIYDTDCNLANE